MGLSADPHVNLVFEYCDHDLTGIMETNRATPLHVSQIKYYAYNLLSALFTCHKQRMLHRDIKGKGVKPHVAGPCPTWVNCDNGS